MLKTGIDDSLRIPGSHLDVFLRPLAVIIRGFRAQILHHLGGGPQHQGIGRNDGALGDQRARAHHGSLADYRAVQNDGPHADQAVVLHRAGVQNHTVAHGHVLAYMAAEVVRQMDAAIILDIGVISNDDLVDVRAQRGVVPDAAEVLRGGRSGMAYALLRPYSAEE